MAWAGNTQPLAGNAEWASNAIITGTADFITGLAFSDQSGSLRIEQSADGTNWDYSTTVAVTGGTGAKFKEDIVAPFVRVRYINGATPQTVFRISARVASSGAR